MDRLQKTKFLTHLGGKVFVSQFEAFCKLTGRRAARDLSTNARVAR